MAEATAPIGIIESGVGGLTTAAQLSLVLPGENIVYCGDNANAPHGNRSGEEIVELTTSKRATWPTPRSSTRSACTSTR